MDIYEKEVNKLLKDMDELNISNEDKIIYLKLYSKMLMDKQAEVENNFILGTFISSIGLGSILNISNIYISSLLFTIGVILSLYKAKKLNEEITIKNIKEYKRSR